ncbi:hypothetical protein Acr_09g0005260 [Actinidia rufa]|uniref:Uncharacterized protein n=1 Tax=Actinidia rufa TaxID=165716 RepID=A0A7J0F5X7_9ERIC|nr:hypothetical protein Acr_09g0005260 [Actinidia rufa]
MVLGVSSTPPPPTPPDIWQIFNPLFSSTCGISEELLSLFSRRSLSTSERWLFNLSSSLVHVDLQGNYLNGSVPDAFGNMISLEHLNLAYNQFEGGIPKSFANLSHLQSLVLRLTNLTEELPEFFQKLYGSKKSFQILDLEGNQLSGTLPDFTRFSSLRELYLGDNQLVGPLPKSFVQILPLSFVSLKMSGNQITGMFPDLSAFPSLTWLRSCKLGPYFPKWLQNQNNFSELGISGAGISDVVPRWFWDLPPSLTYLNISYNQMNGLLPDLSLTISGHPTLDLSSNWFTGQIPRVPSNVTSLILSKNMFSGSISFLCALTGFELTYLDLSSNRLSGGLPDCWEHFEELRVMNLANNNLSGKLPRSMGSLYQIKALQLRNNNFSGEFPMSLKKCVDLRIIDLGGNKFTGKIQAWIGTHLTSLIVLSLKSNKFHGSIPQHICHLNDIQVLDFSHNDLSGKLPRCFNNFSALVQRSSLEDTIDFGYVSGTFVDLYEGYAVIPEQVGSLAKLVSLNLSRNNFSGKITEEIGGMKMLGSLDLSANRLSGEIPTSLARLNYLSMLDLSNNNLSGKIPLSTRLQSFDASTYSGNPQLCGLPLKKCPGEKIVAEPPVTPHGKDERIQEEEEDGFITPGFYISMGLGFSVGFGVVFGIMVFSPPSRYAYFKFLDSIQKNWFYVTTRLNMARLQRRFRS